MDKMKELSAVLDRIAACGEDLVQEAEKVKDLMAVIDGLSECGRTLISSVMALKECFPDTEEPAKTDSEKSKTAMKQELVDTTGRVISAEDVRKILAKASQAGHRSEVIALLNKYGSGNISSLSPEFYETVVKEAEGWTDA